MARSLGKRSPGTALDPLGSIAARRAVARRVRRLSGGPLVSWPSLAFLVGRVERSGRLSKKPQPQGIRCRAGLRVGSSLYSPVTLNPWLSMRRFVEIYECEEINLQRLIAP